MEAGRYYGKVRGHPEPTGTSCAPTLRCGAEYHRYVPPKKRCGPRLWQAAGGMIGVLALSATVPVGPKS